MHHRNYNDQEGIEGSLLSYGRHQGNNNTIARLYANLWHMACDNIMWQGSEKIGEDRKVELYNLADRFIDESLFERFRGIEPFFMQEGIISSIEVAYFFNIINLLQLIDQFESYASFDNNEELMELLFHRAPGLRFAYDWTF